MKKFPVSHLDQHWWMNERVLRVWIKYRGLCLKVMTNKWATLFFNFTFKLVQRSLWSIDQKISKSFSVCFNIEPRANTNDEMFFCNSPLLSVIYWQQLTIMGNMLIHYCWVTKECQQSILGCPKNVYNFKSAFKCWKPTPLSYLGLNNLQLVPGLKVQVFLTAFHWC